MAVPALDQEDELEPRMTSESAKFTVHNIVVPKGFVPDPPRESVTNEVPKGFVPDPRPVLRLYPGPVTPAVNVGGRLFTGPDHVSAYANAKAGGQPDTSGALEGFVDRQGKF